MLYQHLAHTALTLFFSLQAQPFQDIFTEDSTDEDKAFYK